LEGTLYPINFPPQKWEGYYAYYSKVGRFLHLKGGIISLSLLCLMIYIIWFMIKFASCFMVGKAHGWGTFPKWEDGLGYCLIRDPLFRECPYPGLYFTHKTWNGEILKGTN
jgi:hypothetical protein